MASRSCRPLMLAPLRTVSWEDVWSAFREAACRLGRRFLGRLLGRPFRRLREGFLVGFSGGFLVGPPGRPWSVELRLIRAASRLSDSFAGKTWAGELPGDGRTFARERGEHAGQGRPNRRAYWYSSRTRLARRKSRSSSTLRRSCSNRSQAADQTGHQSASAGVEPSRTRTGRRGSCAPSSVR